MSRRDPTLPRPDTSSLPEADLITRVKNDQDSAALLALVDLHAGIYFKVVNNYAASYPQTVKVRDMDEDKLFHIYQFVVAYDSTRGMKLSTYIGERTDYLCRSLLKKDRRNPTAVSNFAPTGAMPLDVDEDTYRTSDGRHITLMDESSVTRVAERANAGMTIESISRVAQEVCHDTRFVRILNYRHLNATMSWRDIGHKIGLSFEGARKLYLRNMVRVKSHLQESY